MGVMSPSLPLRPAEGDFWSLLEGARQEVKSPAFDFSLTCAGSLVRGRWVSTAVLLFDLRKQKKNKKQVAERHDSSNFADLFRCLKAVSASFLLFQKNLKLR